MADIRLLGAVEVWSGDQLLPTGQPRQRSVLAALAADADRVVSWDALIYRVWGESPPDGVRAALYSYITRLRQVLGRAGSPGAAAPQLRRGPGGYILRTDPDTVDLHRFRDLLGQAHSAADGHRAELLREALSLWRGEALSGISGHWAARMREGWAQEQVEATVAWARAERAGGRATVVIGRLSETLATSPLVEPLASELMRALHSTGRRAEALDCYAAMRKRLVEELGTEPGPELRELHQELLHGDATERPGAHVPAQLPRDVSNFTGRETELDQLDALRPGASIAVLVGAAGIGKTTLAVHWAHRAAHRFPDGQLYADLRGFDASGTPTEPSTAIRSLLYALDVAPQRIPPDLDAQCALYRTRLAGRRMLVVLDNARDAEQVRPLLPGTPTCTVVVTSRNQLTGLSVSEGAQLLTLGLMSTEESRQLITARLGAVRVDAEPAAAQEIVDLCAHLPLALSIAAARAAGRPQLPLAAIAADLRHAPDRLDGLRTTDPGTDIRTVFSWSERALTPPAARMLHLLGLHPGPDIALAAAAGLAGQSIADTQAVLSELCGAHLLSEHSSGRFTLHDLLRAYAAEQVPAGDRRTAVDRLLDHYLHHAYAANQVICLDNPEPFDRPVAPDGVLLKDFGDDREALEWLTAEHDCLLAAIEYADSAGDDTRTWQLGRVLAHYLYRRGHWLDHAETGRMALAAARRTGDPTAQALTAVSLARAYIQLSQFDRAEAHLLDALDLAAATDDGLALADTRHIFSWVLDLQDRRPEAFTQAEQALDLYLAAGHFTGQARSLNTIGWFHTKQGDHRRSLDYCEPALKLFQRLGHREGQAATWHSIGHAHHHLGAYQQALACYNQALTLFRDLRNLYFEGSALADLGDTHQAVGDLAAADRAWRQALSILDELHHPHAQRVRLKLSTLRSSS